MKNKKFGIVGLGRMGGSLALNAMDKGYAVAGVDPSGKPDMLKDSAVEFHKDLADLKQALSSPRIVFLYVPAGKIVDKVIDELAGLLDAGDLIVDGGNSYWGDSIRRAERLKEKDILFADCGTSGGVRGARNGACFMYGGPQKVADMLHPILTDLAVEGGVAHAGPNGAGHFVKLVHNGIEFGMLQAIGEGMDLLTHYREKLDIPNILHCWNNGSVIRSWLTELMEEQFKKQDGMENIQDYIEDTGEVNWLIDDAMQMEVPVPVMAQSVMQLISSRAKQQNWARAIAMMRHGFGEHPFGPEENIRKERQEGRIGGFPKKKSST